MNGAVSTERVVASSGALLEITDDAQRLFAECLTRLTEMAMILGNAHGAEGIAALHGAMQYLGETDLGPAILRRSEQLCAWAEATHLSVI